MPEPGSLNLSIEGMTWLLTSQLIDGEMVSWYGSRAADGLRYLARLRETR